MRALYDTSRYLTSFNFYEWLLQAHAKGAKTIVFDIRGIRGDKWPTPLARQRFYSICAPGPALIGLPHEIFDGGVIGSTNARDVAKPGGKAFVDFWKSGGRFKRLATVNPKGVARFTVTLRKTQRSPSRDSDELLWREFAAEIGARVIEDYDTIPIHLHDRVALYAGAEMNYFVSNGPGILCSFTEYPCMLFNTIDAAGSLRSDGIAFGAQYPWMLPGNQRTIWETATRESLRRYHYQWVESKTFAEDRLPEDPYASAPAP